jgi:hypothetical protein
VKTLSLGQVTATLLASCPSWRRHFLRPVAACGSGGDGGGLVGGAACAQRRRGALGPCWQEGAKGPWILKVLSWFAWSGGVSGNGWAAMLLPWWLQISESLAEECEAVGEARPPRRVTGISGFHRRYDESFMLKLHWDRGITDCVFVA